MKRALVGATLTLLLGLSGLAWGQADLAGWTAPATGKIDPTGGRRGEPALSVAATVEQENQPWVSAAYPVQGKYLRASAWMRLRNLYYRDPGFFAYASVEFFDAAGKSLGEQTFLNSRDLMQAESLLYQRMTLTGRLLSFDWRYAEKTLTVPAGAATARAKFGFPFRVVGQAWLDDLQVTFSNTPPPAESQQATSDQVPLTEIRLRTPQYHLDIDPLGPIFHPGEDAVFCVAMPASAKAAPQPVLVSRVTDAEGFTVWQQQQPLTGAGDWATVTVPGSLAKQYLTRYLAVQFVIRDGEQLLARASLSFAFLDAYKLDQIREGPQERYIDRTDCYSRQVRFWVDSHMPMTVQSLHIQNVWKDASQPPDLVAATRAQPYYAGADDLHAMGYGVVMLVADDQGIPDPVPAFSNLGYNSLIKPEALHTFAVAAAKRYPYVKYWRMFCEQYVQKPGYAEAFVADEKAFYEGIKSVLPDAVIIQDNNCIFMDGAKMRDLGLFNYCDAIDPHLYGPVEPLIFDTFLKEKQLLESWGIHKRWISIEFSSFGIGGTEPITQQWMSEELPKSLSSFYALGGEKTCMFGGVGDNPSDLFYPTNFGGAGWGPTVNYLSIEQLISKLGLTPVVGTFTLGDGPRVRYNRFADDQHTVMVAWSREGDNTIKIATQAPVTVTDNIRTAERLQPQNGACYLTVSSQPVYIEGANDMELSLAGQGEVALSAAGGLLAGGVTTVEVSVPDATANTASVLLPPGVTAAANPVPVQDGKATFALTCPADNAGGVATLTFLYGQGEAREGLVVHRYELIRSIHAEVWSDGNIRDSRPRYVVRITNDNPVAATGRVVAESPVASEARPEELEQNFEVAPHKSQDLLFEFSPVDPAEVATILDQERNYPAVASVYPDGGQPFTIRDQVSFTPLPKVTPGLRIDGDLSDWPDQPGFTLGRPEQYVPVVAGAQPGDIHADLHIAWDRANLYFAVKVRGKDAAQSGGIKLFLTNAEDKRMVWYEDKGDYREYDFLRGPDGVKLQCHSRTPNGYGVWYATREVPGGTDYEIALPVWETANTVQIDPDRWVKLSVALLDAPGRGYWQWYGGATEPKNWGAYGDFQLAAYGRDEWGQKYGEAMAGMGRERLGYVGLALLPDGGRVLVRSLGENSAEAVVQNAAGQELRRFPLESGARVHTVAVDADGRLVVGDRALGVSFFSLQDGHKIPVGPLQGFYPVRHIIEYRTQGVAQDAAGNYFVTVLRKRRTTWPEDNGETLLAGITMFTRTGDEVKEFGVDLPFTDYGVVHAWGQMGEMAGGFLYPESLAIDSENRMWVADIDAQTLQIFGRTGPQAYSYARLPLLYTPMPEGLYPCHLQPLPDGHMLLWNADRMAVAALADGQLQVLATAPLDGQVQDLKFSGDTAVTVNSAGEVKTFPLPQ
jgi:hypothetical protein